VANGDPSAVLVASGRIVWHASAGLPLAQAVDVAWPGVGTVYGRLGDAWVVVCAAVVFGAAVWGGRGESGTTQGRGP
jgi:apolipoprotein N-acyltransferase